MSEHEQVTGMLTAKNAASLELDPAHTALIIVDMQRYFTQPSFPFTDLFEKMSPGVCSGYLSRVRETVNRASVDYSITSVRMVRSSSLRQSAPRRRTAAIWRAGRERWMKPD